MSFSLSCPCGDIIRQSLTQDGLYLNMLFLSHNYSSCGKLHDDLAKKAFCDVCDRNRHWTVGLYCVKQSSMRVQTEVTVLSVCVWTDAHLLWASQLESQCYSDGCGCSRRASSPSVGWWVSAGRSMTCRPQEFGAGWSEWTRCFLMFL